MTLSKDNSQIQAAIELAKRKECESSLFFFLCEAWSVLEGGKPLETGWALKALCEHLEEVYHGRIKNFLCNLPPRMTKSTVISVVYPVWVWIQDPSTQIMTISYAEKLAQRDNVKSRRLIKSDWFQSVGATK